MLLVAAAEGCLRQLYAGSEVVVEVLVVAQRVVLSGGVHHRLACRPRVAASIRRHHAVLRRNVRAYLNSKAKLLTNTSENITIWVSWIVKYLVWSTQIKFS